MVPTQISHIPFCSIIPFLPFLSYLCIIGGLTVGLTNQNECVDSHRRSLVEWIKTIEVILTLPLMLKGWDDLIDIIITWCDVLPSFMYTILLLQGLLENEYLGSSFAVGEVRNITGYQALHSAYEISSNTHSKWKNLLVLFLMVVAYRVVVFVLLHFRVGKFTSLRKVIRCNRDMKDWKMWFATSSLLLSCLQHQFLFLLCTFKEWCKVVSSVHFVCKLQVSSLPLILLPSRKKLYFLLLLLYRY